MLDALAARLPDDVLLVEECPSSQPELYQRIPVRVPFGFLSTANGCLGFGLAGSIGLRMGLPDRPVVAVLGDGSTMYAIQALWSAARYDVGVLLVVMANGRYAVMDGLAQRVGRAAAWPGFESVDIGGIARGFGCPSVRVETHADLVRTLDEVLPGWRSGESRCLWKRWWGSSPVATTDVARTTPADITAAAVASFDSVRGSARARADAGARAPPARLRRRGRADRGRVAAR